MWFDHIGLLSWRKTLYNYIFTIYYNDDRKNLNAIYLIKKIMTIHIKWLVVVSNNGTRF